MVKVDESASIIVAYLTNYMSNERKNSHIQWNGHLVRRSSYDPMTHTSHVVSEVKAPQPMQNRIFANLQVWDVGADGNPNSFTIAFIPDKDYDGVTSSSTGALFGSTCGIFVIDSLASKVSNVTLIQTTELKITGAFGDMLSNFAASYFLSILDDLFNKYQRDAKSVDSEIRLAFVDNIEIVPPLIHDYLKQECIALATAFEANDGVPLIKLKKPSGKFNY